MFFVKVATKNFMETIKNAKYHIKHQQEHAKDVKSMDARIVYVILVLQLNY